MNIEQTSESQISVNGITHHIDTIYGDPDSNRSKRILRVHRR